MVIYISLHDYHTTVHLGASDHGVGVRGSHHMHVDAESPLVAAFAFPMFPGFGVELTHLDDKSWNIFPGSAHVNLFRVGVVCMVKQWNASFDTEWCLAMRGLCSRSEL